MTEFKIINGKLFPEDHICNWEYIDGYEMNLMSYSHLTQCEECRAYRLRHVDDLSSSCKLDEIITEESDLKRYQELNGYRPRFKDR